MVGSLQIGRKLAQRVVFCFVFMHVPTLLRQLWIGQISDRLHWSRNSLWVPDRRPSWSKTKIKLASIMVEITLGRIASSSFRACRRIRSVFVIKGWEGIIKDDLNTCKGPCRLLSPLTAREVAPCATSVSSLFFAATNPWLGPIQELSRWLHPHLPWLLFSKFLLGWIKVKKMLGNVATLLSSVLGGYTLTLMPSTKIFPLLHQSAELLTKNFPEPVDPMKANWFVLSSWEGRHKTITAREAVHIEAGNIFEILRYPWPVVFWLTWGRLSRRL